MKQFVATHFHDIPGRGRVWVGGCPFDWKQSDGIDVWRGAWTIKHPDAAPDHIVRVIAVESWVSSRISWGTPVGVMFLETSP